MQFLTIRNILSCIGMIATVYTAGIFTGWHLRGNSDDYKQLKQTTLNQQEIIETQKYAYEASKSRASEYESQANIAQNNYSKSHEEMERVKEELNSTNRITKQLVRLIQSTPASPTMPGVSYAASRTNESTEIYPADQFARIEQYQLYVCELNTIQLENLIQLLNATIPAYNELINKINKGK